MKYQSEFHLEDLKLLIIKDMVYRAKAVSMDDYLKFVKFNLKYTVDTENARKLKKHRVLAAPFIIK